MQAKEKCSLYDPSVVVVLPTNQLSSCLESLSIDDLYPSITLNGVAISDMRDERDDRDDDDSAEKKSASSSNDLEQVLHLTLNVHQITWSRYYLHLTRNVQQFSLGEYLCNGRKGQSLCVPKVCPPYRCG